MTWRDKARNVIYPALREGRQLGLTGRALRRHIRQKYVEYDPLDCKKFFPYRVWLEELEIALAGANPEAPQMFLDFRHG